MIRITSLLRNVYHRGTGWLTTGLLGAGVVLGAACSSGSPVGTDGSDATQGGGPDVDLTVGGSRNRFVVTGPQGGPFPNGQRDYELTNNTDRPLDWMAQSSEPWLRFSDTSGSIPPARSDTVTVTLDGALAATLDPGEHPADIVFSQPGQPDAVFVSFLLIVRPTNSGALMVVNPPQGLDASGEVGGTITPDSKTFTVMNSGDEPMEWVARGNQPWIRVSQPNQGTLQAGAAASIIVSINPGAANNLGQGAYQGNVAFANLTNGFGDTSRPVSLVLDAPTSAGERVVAGLVALYNFEEGSGGQVYDVSGVVPNLDLSIENTDAVRWMPGSLSLESPTILVSSDQATKVGDACQSTNEITVEAWIRPENVHQDGPARIATISSGGSLRNFTLGQGLWGEQAADGFNMRLRTTQTDLDGMPMLGTSSGVATTDLTHVAYTRDALGNTRFYVNGQLSSATVVGGNLSNWDGGYRFALGNEIGADRPWLGEFHLVAIYENALSGSEVLQNYTAGTGNTSHGHLTTSPQSGYDISGREGASFAPGSKTYSITNTGDEPINWQASVADSWVSIAGNDVGWLDPGQSASISVELDEAMVQSFGVGSYSSELLVQNTSNGSGSTSRSISLNVLPPAGGGDGGGGGSTSGIVLVPGSGFNGPTNLPGQIGSGMGADATAIARWDVVPYQRFDEPFAIGIPAFHMNGINRVEFSLQGGPWTPVHEMTMNPRTNVAEYWAVIDPMTVPDGQVEVRAIAYPNTGRPRLVQIEMRSGTRSLMLEANGHGTLPSVTKYVAGNGSDSGNGSASSPYRTLGRAMRAIQDSSGNGRADGGTILCKAGTYDLTKGSYSATTSNSFLTIRPAPGVSKSQVVIREAGGLRIDRLHLKDITSHTMMPGQADYDEDIIWADGCDLTGTGRFDNQQYWFAPWSWGGVYATDCYVANCQDGLGLARLQRNVTVSNIQSDAFQNSRMVINCTAEGIDPTGSGAHPDVFQIYAPGGSSNYIVYGLRSVDCKAQGLYLNNGGSGDTAPLRDVAIVNVIMERHPDLLYATQLVAFRFDHLLVWNSTFAEHTFRMRADDGQTGRNVSIRGNSFSRVDTMMPLTSSVLDNNHFESTSGGGITFGTGISTGNASFVDPASDLYIPRPGSILKNRLNFPGMPKFDRDGNERSVPSSVGAYE